MFIGEENGRAGIGFIHHDAKAVATALAAAIAAAITAADAALAIDPLVKNAYVQKGYALFRMAREADDEAREHLLPRAAPAALTRSTQTDSVKPSSPPLMFSAATASTSVAGVPSK